MMFRKNDHSADEHRIPLSAKIAMGVSFVQLVMAFGGFMTTTFEETPILILFALVGVAAVIAAAVVWSTLESAHRRIVRRVLIGVPTVMAAFGVVCAVCTTLFSLSTDSFLNLSASSDDATFWYTLMFDVSLTFTYAHIIMMFLFPTFVTMASFGHAADGKLLRTVGLVNLALMLFNVVYTTPMYHIPVWNTDQTVVPTWYIASVEVTPVQIAMVVLAAVLAVLCFLPNRRVVEEIKKQAPSSTALEENL